MGTSSALVPRAGRPCAVCGLCAAPCRASRSVGVHWLAVGRPVSASMTRPPLSASEPLPLLSLRPFLAELHLVKKGGKRLIGERKGFQHKLLSPCGVSQPAGLGQRQSGLGEVVLRNARGPVSGHWFAERTVGVVLAVSCVPCSHLLQLVSIPVRLCLFSFSYSTPSTFLFLRHNKSPSYSTKH